MSKESPSPILGQLAGSGALFLAVTFLVGFLSQRAYANMLGLPFDVDATYQDYLQAGIRCLTSSLLAVAVPATLALLLFLAIRRLRPRAGAVCGRIGTAGANAIAIVFLLAALIPLVQPLAHRDLLFEDGAHVVGGAGPARWTYLMLELIVFVSVALAWIFVTRVNRQHRDGRFLSLGIVTLLSIQLILLPIDYGILMVPTEFSRVRRLGDAAVTGRVFLLGSDASANLVLYDRDQRTVTRLPDKDAVVVLGPREDIFADGSAR